MVKLEERIEDDYISIESETLGPEFSCSLIRHRRNGVLRVKRCSPIHDFTDITYIMHPDIATIYSIYGSMAGCVFVEEYLELRLADLLPLTEVELASATSQIIDGFHHLSQLPIRSELDEIRVSLAGRVKLGKSFSKVDQRLLFS
ncbi:hypothetical protein FOFC_15946 [Fusarium oxysporum]|nr:hypothetical protein FOFC_15946 [Fusarium oxysporum]